MQDMLGPEQAYEGLYGQGGGPASVQSSHGARTFQQGMFFCGGNQEQAAASAATVNPY